MIKFFVPGIAIPKGSKRVFNGVMVEANKKTMPWLDTVRIYAAQTAQQQRLGLPLIPGPVSVKLQFWFPRPKYHYNAKGELKPTAPVWHVVKPDADKLERCVFDALTGIVWVDDSQVCETGLTKKYVWSGAGPGVHIEIEEKA